MLLHGVHDHSHVAGVINLMALASAPLRFVLCDEDWYAVNFFIGTIGTWTLCEMALSGCRSFLYDLFVRFGFLERGRGWRGHRLAHDER